MEIPDSDAERRQHARRPFRSVAVVVVSGTKQIEVRTVNLGAGGMGIIASANPKPGTTFTIAFSLQTGPKTTQRFATQVQVTHAVLARDHDGFKVGLRFVSVGSELAAAIAQYLK